jgi:hypothetical membrane protein
VAHSAAHLAAHLAAQKPWSLPRPARPARPGRLVTAAVSPPRQRPAPSRAKPLARFTLTGVVVYVAIDVLLAFLRPSYSLLYNAESDYGRGPWYWVMDLNFLLRCALSLAIASALYQVLRRDSRDSRDSRTPDERTPDGRPADGRAPDGRARAGLALLVTWAICSGLLAFFADDPEGTPQHGSGVVHLILAFIAFTCIVIGAILISASLMSDPAWRPAGPALLAISIAAALAYLLLGGAHKHHHTPAGLYERIFLGLELLWMAVAALAITRRAPSDRPEPSDRPDPSDPPRAGR